MELGTTVYIFQPSPNEMYTSVMYEGEITRIYKEVYKCPREQKECVVAYDVAVEGHGMWHKIKPEAISTSKREAIEKIKKELENEDAELSEKRKLLHFKIYNCVNELAKL